MSGLTGVLWRNGRRATPSDVEFAIHSLSHRGRVVANVALQSVVAACLQPGIEAPEGSSHPDLPNVYTSPDLVVMVDGNLDDASSLASQLDLPTAAGSASIVAAAWRRWGRDCAARLVGNLTFVVSDGRSLFAAREPVGFRPLFYRWNPEGFRWASEWCAIVDGNSRPINEAIVAEYLADSPVTMRETLFRDVHRLPPAHALHIAENGVPETWEYWRPNPPCEIRYRRQSDYDEHFRGLFRDAVRRTLRAPGTVGLWYSGGVDSTAIACEVSALRDRGGLMPRVEAFSMSMPGYDVEDETQYFTEGAQWFQLPLTVEPVYFATYDEYASDASRSLDVPEPPNSISAKRIWETLVRRSIQTTLTGIGGDQWFLGTQEAMVDDLARGRLRSVWRRLRLDPPLQVSLRPWPLLRHSLALQLPSRWLELLRDLKGRPQLTPPIVNRSFAQRVNLEDRLRQQPPSSAWRSHSQAAIYNSVMHPATVMQHERQARVAAKWGVETRHPFHDREMIEFALALPANQLWSPGLPRFIVLNALRDRLPPFIYRRIDGVNYTIVVADALLRLNIRERFAQLRPAMQDWVDWQELDRILSRVETATPAERRQMWKECWGVWQAFSIGVWSRALQN